jgi:hypothetical protein
MAPVPVMPNEAEVAAALYHYVTPALACGRVPTFGTAEWVALGEDDPAKHAAVVRAALAHWGAALAAQQAHVQASQAIAAVAHRPGWKVEQIEAQRRMESC